MKLRQARKVLKHSDVYDAWCVFNYKRTTYVAALTRVHGYDWRHIRGGKLDNARGKVRP